MCERFLKLNIEKEKDLPADWLIVNHPNAFILLYFIARRARRISGSLDGLEIGMAQIGDWEKMGLTRQNYRTALKILTTYKFIEIIETNRTLKNLTKNLTTKVTTGGTLVRLLDSSIWDINPESPNHRSNHRSNHPLTTNKERIRDISNDISRNARSARTHPATPIRSKDSLIFNFETWKFEGITEKDLSEWKVMYPHIDLQVETLKASQWLKNNPSKSNKKQWRKYLTGWFGRSNDSIENKKAYRSAFGSPQDKRTKNMDGTPIKSLAEDLF